MSQYPKDRGYSVKVEKNLVVVEHRACFRPRTILFLSIGFLVYCLLPTVREVLVDAFHSRDLIVAGFALFILLIPFISGLTFFFFASGEVMRCDAKEFHFAKRRTWGRWHRFRFDVRELKEIHLASRGGGRARYYTVLTFQHVGKSYDVLEDMDPNLTDRVLSALIGMGLDAYKDSTKMPSYKMSLRSDLP